MPQGDATKDIVTGALFQVFSNGTGLISAEVVTDDFSPLGVSWLRMPAFSVAAHLNGTQLVDVTISGSLAVDCGDESRVISIAMGIQVSDFSP
ncbi:hypothetical protein OAO87_02040 [bacterium]|nr:hypothetical protein [bacterium]